MNPPGRRGVAATAAALALLVGAVHHRILLLGQTLALRDNPGVIQPSRAFLGAALREGRLPEWADWMGLGMPFAANPVHGVTSPATWLTGLLPPALAADLLMLGYLLAAALGAAALARRWGAGPGGAFLSGALLACSGYVTSILANGMAPMLAWTPWVAWAADRVARPGEGRWARTRAALVLAPLVALQLVAGEPASALLALLLGGAVTLLRADRVGPALLAFALAVAGALPLAAATILPALGMVGWSARSGGVDAANAALWSMPPARVAELLWPGLLGDGTRQVTSLLRLADGAVESGSGPTWSFSVFIGAPALLLAAAGAAAFGPGRWLALLSAAFVLLAFGAWTPAFAAFSWAFPPARLARFPEKYLLASLLTWCALAGVGLEALARRPPGRWLTVAAVTAAALLAAAAGLAWWGEAGLSAAVAARAAARGLDFDARGAVAALVQGGALAALAAAAFAGLLLASSRGAGWWSVAGAGAAALLPLVLHVGALTPTMARALVEQPPALLAPLRPPPGSATRLRLLRQEAGAPLLPEQAPNPAELSHALARVHAAVPFGFAIHPLSEGTSSRAWAAFLPRGARLSERRYAQRFGMDLVLHPDAAAMLQTWPVVSQGGGWTVQRVEGGRPRAFVAPRWSWGTEAEALDALVDVGRGDLGRVMLVGAGESSPPGPADEEPLAPCAIESTRPEALALRCDSRLGGWAVLLDEPAPGWSAAVDGRPAALERADGLFRAVRVGPGPHLVRFDYRTPGLRAGAALALAAWLAWLAAWWWLRRASHPPAGAR